MIRVEELRRWVFDSNNELIFKVKKYKSFFINTHYYIIEYISDNREQTASKEDLINDSIIFQIN